MTKTTLKWMDEILPEKEDQLSKNKEEDDDDYYKSSNIPSPWCYGNTNDYKIDFPSAVIITGPTKSGKTKLMMLLLKENAVKNFHVIYVLCPTIDLQDSYNFIPSEYKIREPDESFIENLMEIQKTKYKGKRKVCIILDDCLGIVSFRNSNILHRLTGTGRHYGISTFIITQDLKLIDPTIRLNTWTIFIMGGLREHNFDAIYSLTTGFESKQHFKQFINQHTTLYGAIRINTTAGCKYSAIVLKPTLSKNLKFNF